MNHHTVRKIAALCAVSACFGAITVRAVEGPHHLLANQDFDNDTVGLLATGWSGLPTSNNKAYVTNNVSVSNPNSFALQYQNGDSSTLISLVTPMQYSLTNAGQWIAYEFDVNVDYINSNNSEGFAFRLWNATFSQIDTGSARILANSGGWQFFNGLAGQNGGLFYLPTIYSFDTWHHLRVKILEDGNTGPVATPYFGRTLWYVDNVLANTETWTNRNFNQVREIDTLDVSYLINQGARINIDNLVIEAIPEPTALALLFGAGTVLLVRRRK